MAQNISSKTYLSLYLIDYLDSGNDLVEGIHWVIYPLINPDGYLYSWSQALGFE